MSILLPLTFLDKHGLIIRPDRYKQTQEEIETFLCDQDYLNSRDFAKSVLFSHEIKNNNQVEGYNDDVELVKAVINNKVTNLNSQQRQRIINLYNGYNFILKNSDINKESLRELYSILSNDILEPYAVNSMGKYYREGPVYILKGGRIDIEADEGMPFSELDKFMDVYFDFLNNNMFNSSITEEYIKSQILHFYFVYIHPYFDVNGRTSRTLAMWYLLNKKAYPYIIFNRGITFRESDYDKIIRDTKQYHDISYFVDYMLKTVQAELEKEYIMQSINEYTNANLTSEDYQSLLYLLSMNSQLTVLDFSTIYNRFNEKKRTKEIYESALLPLIEKGILCVKRTTNKNMFDDIRNQVLDFSPGITSCYDKDKIQVLSRLK